MAFDFGTSSQSFTANSRTKPKPGIMTDSGVAIQTTRGRFEERIGSQSCWMSEVQGTTASPALACAAAVGWKDLHAKKAVEAIATTNAGPRTISRVGHPGGGNS